MVTYWPSALGDPTYLKSNVLNEINCSHLRTLSNKKSITLSLPNASKKKIYICIYIKERQHRAIWNTTCFVSPSPSFSTHGHTTIKHHGFQTPSLFSPAPTNIDSNHSRSSDWFSFFSLQFLPRTPHPSPICIRLFLFFSFFLSAGCLHA